MKARSVAWFLLRLATCNYNPTDEAGLFADDCFQIGLGDLTHTAMRVTVFGDTVSERSKTLIESANCVPVTLPRQWEDR